MKTECRRCKGYGLLRDHKLLKVKNRGTTQINPVECHECKGKGLVEFPGKQKKK